jgi:toxin ParE1/3/4
VTAGKLPWALRLSAATEIDFRDIMRWTAAQFGEARARTYAATISAALEALAKEGPVVVGAKPRDDIFKGLMALHVARDGRKGRHVVLVRVARAEKEPTVEVVRILHDAMDLVRHLDTNNGPRD